MKVRLFSDLHLEFGDFDPGTGDVLVLSGDILTAKDLVNETLATERFISFLNKAVEGYNKVFYVMGNHEHYNHNFQWTAYSYDRSVKPR